MSDGTIENNKELQIRMLENYIIQYSELSGRRAESKIIEKSATEIRDNISDLLKLLKLSSYISKNGVVLSLQSSSRSSVDENAVRVILSRYQELISTMLNTLDEVKTVKTKNELQNIVNDIKLQASTASTEIEEMKKNISKINKFSKLMISV
jgi:3-oxoacyl-ACP reductase-like protein